MRSAPRGIVLGPIIWVWTDINANQHPTLFAFLTRDGWGSKIVGTTGYFLAILASQLALIGIAYWAISGLIAGSLFARGVIPILIVLSAGFALLVFLIGRLDHTRNPSVELLLDLFVHPDSEPTRSCSLDAICALPVDRTLVDMDLLGSKTEVPVKATPERLRNMLSAMECGDEEFVILQKADCQFIQAAPEAYGYRIELRREADDWPRPAQRIGQDKGRPFLIKDVAAIMSLYLHGEDSCPDILWD